MSRQSKSRVKAQNMMLNGDNGQGVPPQDRGANQNSVVYSSNPYYNQNYLFRYQEYVRWYQTAWEARKIVDIPVDDAFRVPFKLKNITQEDTEILMAEYRRLNVENTLVRAAKQERLLGGCASYMVITDGNGKTNTTDKPVDFDFISLRPEALRKLNVIDINLIARGDISNDPFSEDYDTPTSYRINGIETHKDRLIVFDGAPLFNRQNMNVLGAFRVNPTGFGESTLAPLYEELVRATGTRQGAYHLVNMASVLLLAVDNLKSLKATKPGEAVVSTLEEMARQVSIYRAAMVEGQGVEFSNHAASFGSVPELVITFLQVLSAASDIPATRFLGQAPGGLNATGEGDLENYYNMIDGYQRRIIKPRIMSVFEIIGVSKFGKETWKKMKEKLEIVFPPLWNLDGKEQGELAQIFINALLPLYREGIMTLNDFQQELVKHGVFMTDVKLNEAIDEADAGIEAPIDPKGKLAKMSKQDPSQVKK